MACLGLNAQEPAPALEKPQYDKKEEIIFQNKRYRIHNNYLTFGRGLLASTIQLSGQAAYGADYHFHIRRHYMLAGALLSGESLFAANDAQLHVCYGIREEKNFTNVSLFGGPSLFTGVAGTPGVTAAKVYTGVGVYACFEAVFKIRYDIGLGFDVFAELSAKRNMGGLKVILYFSGAYMGKKGNYNPHVRSESKR